MLSHSVLKYIIDKILVVSRPYIQFIDNDQTYYKHFAILPFTEITERVAICLIDGCGLTSNTLKCGSTKSKFRKTEGEGGKVYHEERTFGISSEERIRQEKG